MENIERVTPKPFEIYRHFKGNLYQILSIATHSETNETLVVYQALYGDFGIYARPLTMFLSEVDKTKYPESPQKFRFDRIGQTQSPSVSEKPVQGIRITKIDYPAQLEISTPSIPVNPAISKEAQFEPDTKERAEKLFIEFLDEDDFLKKRNILKSIANIATDSMINNMAASLDLVVTGSSRDRDIKMIDDYIRARIHFDGARLRN